MLKVFSYKTFYQYWLAYFLIVGGLTLVLLSFGTTIRNELNYYWDKVTLKKYVFEQADKNTKPKSVFGGLIKGQVINVKPVNNNFSIVIEKVGINAPVVKNVSVTDENMYFEALKKGVAHAAGTSLPGQEGNIYLFAHSSIEFWKLGPYATVFNQIRRLENKDTIYLVYEGRIYKYQVFSKKIVTGFDTKPLLATYAGKSVLTLQTCDPPGTILNRLIVRAVLVTN